METKDKTTMTIRINRQTKDAARQVLDSMGLDMSTAITLFLNQVATDNGLPFRPSALSPIDEATLRAEEDVKAGRVTEYANFEEFKNKLNSL